MSSLKLNFLRAFSSYANESDSDSSVTAGKKSINDVCLFSVLLPRRQCSLFEVFFIVHEQAKMVSKECHSGNNTLKRLEAVFTGRNYFIDRKAQNKTRKKKHFLSYTLST